MLAFSKLLTYETVEDILLLTGLDPCRDLGDARVSATRVALPPECDEGNVEYKLRLKANPLRFQQLVCPFTTSAYCSWTELCLTPACVSNALACDYCPSLVVPKLAV